MAALRWQNDTLNIWTAQPGGLFTPVTDLRGHRLQDYFWRADGRGFLVTLDNEDDGRCWTANLDLETGDIARLSPPGVRDARLLCQLNGETPRVLLTLKPDAGGGRGLMEVGLDGSAGHQLAGIPSGVIQWVAGRNGQTLLGSRSTATGSEWLYRAKPSAEWRCILKISAEDTLTTRPLAFDPSGRRLFALTSACADTTSLVEVDPATSAMNVVASGGAFDISGVYFDVERGIPFAFTSADPAGEIQGLDPVTSTELAQMTRALPYQSERVRVVGQRKNEWLMEVDGRQRAPQFFHYDRTTRRPIPLAHRYEALENVPLRPRTPFWFTGSDGVELQGFHTMPSGAPPWPTVLAVHGGPWTRDQAGFDSVAQWVASLGYLCVQVNFRGSTGRGRDFLSAGDRQWGRLMHQDLKGALVNAVQLGIADPNRLAAMGSSYGGYAVLMLAADRQVGLRCVVSMSAPIDLVSFVSSAVDSGHAGASEYLRRIGDPANDRAALVACSPLTVAGQICCPVFVAHGKRDARVPWAHAERLIELFHHRRTEYETVSFDNEGHRFARPENLTHLHSRVERFFRHNLGIGSPALLREGGY